MTGIDIAKLILAVGKYVAGNPELIAKIVGLTTKVIEKLYGEESTRAITEDDALVEQVMMEYLS